MNERVIVDIASIEANRENLQHLESAIPLLSRRLLYGNLEPEVEAQGYKQLRALSGHSDMFIRRIAEDALDARWKKVGFYYRHVPNRRFPLPFDIQRPTMRESDENIMETLGESQKVVLLELVRRFSDPEAQDLTIGQYEELVNPLLGTESDPKHALNELKKRYLLNEEGKFVPVIESDKGKFKLGKDALEVLSPHLPALEAISYHENAIGAGEMEIVKAVGNSVDRTFKAGLSLFSNENVNDLTIQEDEQSFLPSLISLEIDLDDKLRSAREEFKKDTISFLDENGNLYRITHSPHGQYDGKRIAVSLYKQPLGARRRLLLDFWGQQIRGEESGSLEVEKKGHTIMQATGELKPTLPGDLQKANEISISEEEIVCRYEEALGIKGKHGDVQLKFATPYKTTYSGYSSREDIETHVSGIPSTITLPASSEYKPKRRRKRKEEADDLGLSEFSRRMRSWKEIQLDQSHGEFQIRHPNGGYTFSYEFTEDSLQISFKGKGWERTMVVPGTIDPTSIVQEMEDKFSVLTGRVQDDRDVIHDQVSNIRRLTLAEQHVLNVLEIDVEDSDLRDYAVRKLSESGAGLLGYMNTLDDELTKLDPKTQWIIRTYCKILHRSFYEKYLAKEGEPKYGDEDPRDQMRFMIRKNSVNLPTRMLELCEAIFYPEGNHPHSPTQGAS